MAKGCSSPDRGWSWVVAFACCFSSLVLAGIFRTSGVLFVAFISDFGVSREEASWPMVLCISVLNLTGPLSGILARKFGGRPVIITGAVVAASGISACYFTTSLKVITILFGGVFGVGYGFMNTIMPGILNSYFLNLRATANGIANSGSCIGSIILPIAFEHFIHTYGLSGCFLLTGGIVLHITIAGALMRPPPWLSKKAIRVSQSDPEKSAPKTESDLVKRSVHNEASEVAEKTPRNTTACRLIEIQSSSSDLNFESGAPGSPIGDKHSASNAQPVIPSDPQNIRTSASGEFSKDIQPTNHKDAPRTIKQSHLDAEIPTESGGWSCPCAFGNQCREQYSGMVHPFKSVLSCPMFYVTGITNVTFYFLYHMYVVIIVDYALDTGVPEASAKHILFAFSLSDLFGRLCLGWITDRRFVSRPRFVMGCMVMIGIVFFAFPLAEGYWPLIAVSCSYGLLLGCTMVVFPILLVDFLGIELHSVSYGCMCFMNGFASFGRPFLIGYFRDNVGSYSSMFYVLGTISVVAAMLWLLEGVFPKKQVSAD